MAEIGFDKRDFRMVSCIVISNWPFCTQASKNNCWWSPGGFLHGPGLGVRTKLSQVQDPEGRMFGPAWTLPWGSVCSQVQPHNWPSESSYLLKTLLKLSICWCDLSVYSDILRMDSTNADALYVRGLCLYYEDCIDKAVQFFVQALRMAPDHEKARLACRVSIFICNRGFDCCV